MSFSLIAAIGQNNELGKKGGLVFKIPGDLKFFKETTIGHPVFMGLNTWRSLPGKLPDRDHYVLTPDAKEVENDDVAPVTDLDEFINTHKDTDEEIFVIGGGMVYTQMLPHCDALYLTEVDASDPEADTFFPEFDKNLYNRHTIAKNSDNDISYSHVLYVKKDIPYLTTEDKTLDSAAILQDKKLYKLLQPYRNLAKQLSGSDDNIINKRIREFYANFSNMNLLCKNYRSLAPARLGNYLTAEHIKNFNISELLSLLTLIQRSDYFSGGYGNVYPEAVKNDILPQTIDRILNLYEEKQ